MTKPRYAFRLGARSLRRAVPSLTPAQAAVWADALGPVMAAHGITTAKRATKFIATIAHETGGFVWLEEIASGAAYEGRRDLGNVKSGDGRRFKGRGLIMITGRTNYAAASRAAGIDMITAPTLASRPRYAAKIAAWWWDTHGCNALADEPGMEPVTRRVNGGLNGIDDRNRYYRRALLVAPFLIPKRRKP